MALLYYLDEIAGIPIVRIVANGVISAWEWLKVQVKIWSNDQVPMGYRLCAEILPGSFWNDVSPAELDLMLRLEKLSPKALGAKEAIVARPRRDAQEDKVALYMSGAQESKHYQDLRR